MISDAQRDKIIQFAKKHVAENDPYHGMEHLEETARLAVELSKSEGADAEICWVAAMLHDIRKGKSGDHGTEGAIEAKKFLLEIDMDEGFAEKVKDAIHFHNKGFNGGPVERQILWDADKLQLMNLEGFKKRMIPYWIHKLGETEGIRKSIYEYYFYKERFHTETAKREAEKNTEEMEEYFRVLRERINER